MPADPGPVTVREAPSARRFLDAPRRLYRGDAHYVPPLTLADRWQVDPRKNPFFAHARGIFLLAYRGRQPVGRISAVRDDLHDEFHGDRIGFFGHFEAADEATAHQLLDRAGTWLREQGATALRGPVDLSTNYRCGLLVAGEPGPPVVMMNYNPPVYADYLESYGLAKARDVLALLLEDQRATDARFERLVGRIADRTGARIRPLNLRKLPQELGVIWSLYNLIWQRNWGFVPMTEAEFRRSSAELKLIAEPELLTVVEIEDRPVAFALNIPDVNVAIKACNGRLLPFGWWRFLRTLRRGVGRSRVVTLGVHPDHRKQGLDAMLLHYYRHKNPELGYPQCEASWILEDNHEMLRVLKSLGAREYRRYRIYEKAL